MTALFATTFPFFALVLAGYLAARARLLPLEAVPGLNAFVLFFALPCMLFRLGAALPIGELLDPAVLGLYLLCAALVVAFTLAVTLSPRVNMKNAAFGALVAAFPNSGFMGVPLITALLGTDAAGPVMATVLGDIFVTSSLCIALAQTHSERHTEPGEAGNAALLVDSGLEEPPAAPGLASRVLRALRAALGNPLPWAIGAGALASVTGLQLPGPLARAVAMLADAASPVALFTIGAMLWRARAAAERDAGAAGHAPGPQLVQALLRDTPVALIKLLLHPGLVLLLGLALRQLGVPLTPGQLLVLVLVAALPSASNVSLLSERYRADSARVVRIILVSTVLAFFSFTTLVWLLKP